MKNIILFLLLFPVIGYSQYTSIPDQNFEQALIDLGYDNIIDGQVFSSLISSMTSLDIDGLNISDLTGIEDFTALTFLYCNDNQLTILDLTNNTALNRLYCHNNQLTSLNFSNDTVLTRLHCYNNQLTSLDVSNNTSLIRLHCYGNQLTSLDVSNNTALTYLYCYDNQLTSLDVSQNIDLDRLYCNDNQLTSLDVNNLITLTYLYCYDNQLTNLDVSGCTALRWLNLSDNQLNSLDISQNTALEWLNSKNNLLKTLDLRNGNNVNFIDLFTDNNDSLYCISVDDSAWSANNWSAAIDSQTSFSNDCNPSTNDIIENLNNLLIYPNPTNENITISIEKFNGNIQTEVYDLIGNRLQISNENTISLQDYARGIYLLKVAYGDRVEELKVIKE
jgi:Leucine-rich repeat (LRR) protein